jgi:metallo-beta-lactamase family protein
MKGNKSKLTFYGGAGSVTGANFLLENDDIKILVDCGLRQDKRLCHDCNYEAFDYDASSVDVLFVTHAHLDHIGRIPKLVASGFKGVIYSTPSTLDITKVMFEDGVRLMAAEAKKLGREPLYTKKDVEGALRLWKTIEYHEAKEFSPGYEAYFKDAGHILGSVIVEITHKSAPESPKIAFTGDLGNSPTPLLKDTEDVTDADYMVMESVYGDRNHETNMQERSRLFRDTIIRAVDRGGVLMIPTFSIERTQIMLHELNHLVEEKKIPSIPIFLDSPLAIKVTKIYQTYLKNFKKHVQDDIARGDDIFDFPRLQLTVGKEESKGIAHIQGPKIIMAGSGMSYGGRIMFHEKLYLNNKKNTILFVGYQVPGTVGRQIQDGNKRIDILGKKVKVRAHIETISGFSAHKDSNHLAEFVGKSAKTLKKVFLAMGEPKASLFLAQRLTDYHEIDTEVPKEGDTFEIDF